MRKDTNQKIRKLGFKYYQVKIFFDKLILKIDDLFLLEKELVEEFQNSKKDERISSLLVHEAFF